MANTKDDALRFDALPVIERLFERVERAESQVAGDHLRPVADRFAGLLAQCRELAGNCPEAVQAHSAQTLADDLRDALVTCFGLVEIPCDDYDPRLHDVVDTIGDGEVFCIERVVRPGFRRADRVLQPAQVVLRRQ